MVSQEGAAIASLGDRLSALRRLSVRARTLGYLVVLAAGATTIAGVVAYALEIASIDRGISESLTLRAESFLHLANEGHDPLGQRFSSAEALLNTGVSQVIASPTESAVGHADGVALYVPDFANQLALEDDPDFLLAATGRPGEPIVVRGVRTDLAEYRYVSIPLVDDDGRLLATFTVASDRGAQVADLNHTFAYYLLASVVAIAVVGAAAWVTVGRLLRPISLLEETTREISETDLGRRIPIVGHDDLARLSETVNAMLGRIERAFAAQRQLLDDAGHELRTPLAVMRTNLELLEPRDQEQVVQTQEMLLDEVAMMSRLVDDLVILAKADRPEFVVPEPLDLGDLTDATFGRAQALGERAWALESRAEGTVRGDAQRLTQAWMQLVSNAVKFSEPGSAVQLGSSVGPDEFRLWVRDAGRGIPRKFHERILERFQRVDDSVDGAGLGLPIVAAIARAHGGRIEVESAPGVGSRFDIVVPRTEGER